MSVESPKKADHVSMSWGSDAIAELLRRLDLKFLTLNPGASFRGLQDSLVNYLGNRDPQIMLTLHEEAAVAIAHGYAKVTGKPMGVVVHSNVGLMHATMAIFNAWCDRVPVIILGATGPVDAVKRRPWIDWIHTAGDQAALVRDYTKWDDQPGSVTAALESILRASQLSRTAPQGPVYICLDMALQETRLEDPFPVPDPSRFEPAPPQGVSRGVLLDVAKKLLGAERPVILAGRVSRSQERWDDRVRLAESMGAKVVTDIKVGAAFPTLHPLHGAGPSTFTSKEAVALIRDADVILSLDWVDLSGTLKQVWGKEEVSATVIQCSVDCYSHRGWSMDYQGLPPVDIPVLAEPDVMIPPLLAVLDELGGTGKEKKDHGEMRHHAADLPDKSGPITYYHVAAALKRVMGERKTCLIRLPIGWPADACDFRGPLDYLGSDGGGGVGAGPGLAVGAALALRGTDRFPVAVLGDGDYLMGANALWTAAHYQVPLLIIIANNRSFYNCEGHQMKVATARSRPVENRWIGQRIADPAVDLSGLARVQGLDGEGPIVDLAELSDALTRAVEAVDQGRGYVVDVVVTPG